MAAQKAGPALAEIITLLQELSASADARLSPAAENQVRLQYRDNGGGDSLSEEWKIFGVGEINQKYCPSVLKYFCHMTNLEDVLTQTISQQCVVTQTRQRLGPIITTILYGHRQIQTDTHGTKL